MRLARRPTLWAVLSSCVVGCLYDSGDRCGPHQEYKSKGTVCVCEDGYVFSDAGCVEMVAPGPGSGADAGPGDEAGAANDGGRKPYTGQKTPCTSDATCAGFDATYCDPFLKICLVTGCSESSCDHGYMCFDLSMFAPGAPKACVEAMQ